MSVPFKIGVLVEAPIGFAWSHEGLVRLLYFIAAGFESAGAKWVLVCPSWMQQEIQKDLDEQPEYIRRCIEVVAPNKNMPALLSIQYANYRKKFRQKAQSDNLFSQLKAGLRIAIKSTANLIIKTESKLLLLLFSIFLAPLLSIKLAINVLARTTLWRKSTSLIYRIKRRVKAYLPLFLNLALDEALKNMAKSANKIDDIDCWFLHHPFSIRHADQLKKPIVSLFADFVPATCPGGFPTDLIARAESNFKKIKDHVTYFITLSEHVKTQHAINKFSVPREQIICIPHAPVDVAENQSFTTRLNYPTTESKTKAANVIRAHIHKAYRPNLDSAIAALSKNYLLDFPFEDITYVFVSTQNRPYKNTLRVIKAVEHLIREQYFDVKLIMTGDLTPELSSYIENKFLHHDILCIPRVPPEVHAALYHCAAVTIHASFFEGGVGTFPFYESLSMGTPVIVTRNAANEEFDGGEYFEETMVDPYSVDAIAKRIKEVILNRHETFQKQASIYLKKMARTWDIVAKEYVEVFKAAIVRGRAKPN